MPSKISSSVRLASLSTASLLSRRIRMADKEQLSLPRVVHDGLPAGRHLARFPWI
jgi:hypothetical protein